MYMTSKENNDMLFVKTNVVARVRTAGLLINSGDPFMLLPRCPTRKCLLFQLADQK